MFPDLPPLINKSALIKLGWTPCLIAVVLGRPNLVRHAGKGRYSWVEHLWTRDRVVEGMRDLRFVSLQEKREFRKAAIAKRRQDIPRRFSDWRQALPEACVGMFNLNRYAKHKGCSEVRKVEIYRLKNQFIELLYAAGYCTCSWIHRLKLEALGCRECGGMAGEFCDRCGGTGIYRQARTVEFWCFKFVVAGKAYCWHQPMDLVNFSPVESLPPQDWEGLGSMREKPVVIPQSRFAEFKELLQWVIEQAEVVCAQPPVCGGLLAAL